MEDLVKTIHKSLTQKRKTVAVAESCTAGLSSSLLTSLSGSSQYFTLGIITYSNKAKELILKIPHNLIAKYGAVSKRIALKMAEGIKKLAKSDLAIGITGIAGPTGGTTKKPVGTVFIAIVDKNNKICKKFNFKGNRATIRKKAALKSLELLKIVLDLGAPYSTTKLKMKSRKVKKRFKL